VVYVLDSGAERAFLRVSNLTVAELERGGALLAVDNTFLTPALQRPLDLAADGSSSGARPCASQSAAGSHSNSDA